MLSPKMGLSNGSDPADGTKADDATGDATKGVGWPLAMVRDAASNTSGASRMGLNLHIMQSGLSIGDVRRSRNGESQLSSPSLAPFR